MSGSTSHLCGPHGAGTAAWRALTPLHGEPSTTEPSCHPAIEELWSKVLGKCGVPCEVRVTTAEQREKGAADLPDVALCGAGELAAVYAEEKRPVVEPRDVAVSTERDDGVGRHLARTGVVLVTNVRAVGFVAGTPGCAREPEPPVPPAQPKIRADVEPGPSLESRSPRTRASGSSRRPGPRLPITASSQAGREGTP